MLETVVLGNTYRNKKTGNLYYVLAFVKHTETHEDMVLYRRVDAKEDNTFWVRPLEGEVGFKNKFTLALVRDMNITG